MIWDTPMLGTLQMDLTNYGWLIILQIIFIVDYDDTNYPVFCRGESPFVEIRFFINYQRSNKNQRQRVFFRSAEVRD